MTSNPKDARIRMLQHNVLRLTRLLARSPQATPVGSDIVIPDLSKSDDEIDIFSSNYVVPDIEEPAKIKKGRAAVVCWDLGHNPAGRAIVLYDLLSQDWDVDLVGPLWSQFGGKIWPPIAKSGRNFRTFPCDTLEQFYPAATAFAETNAYDLVVVSKPRAPSLAMGAMIKKHSGCPMVLDVDDLELSFADNQEPLSESAAVKKLIQTFREPYESLAIRYSENLISDADSITVSNIALQNRYGGHIVRHARDENLFNPDHYDRNLARQKLGLNDKDFALMFVGTPRPHKGIYTIAEALHEMNDSRFVLNIVGNINYPDMRKKLESYSNARINFYPGCDFTELPFYLAAADVVPLLQRVDNEIAQYQIPAKISDATAFGVPVVTTELPPIYDLEQQNLVRVIHADYFPETLQELYKERSEKGYAKEKARLRAGFEDEFGFQVNRQRLNHAIAKAQKAPETISKPLQNLLDNLQTTFSQLEKKSKPTKAKSGKPDLVMFWKQNDSGLFGRRSDMIMKHLISGNHFGRILQFDAPINLEDLAKLAEKASSTHSSSSLTVTNAIKNKYHLNDTDRHFLRTFIWSDGFRNSSLIDGTSKDVYIAYIEENMTRLGFDPANTTAWVCPVVFDFPNIANRIPFANIVCDIIDDQRAFDLTPDKRRRVEKNYEDILPQSDVVMTNCQPNVEAFEPLTKSIHFVPNGTEIPTDNLAKPKALENIPTPIAGYVGNLQDRIDWDLLEEAAQRLPDVSFVIVGGGAKPQNVTRLDQHPNVYFTGVVPYEKVQAYIQHFDVCIVPHKGTELTKRMNPLKVYNYFAAKKPIVATEVENIDGILSPYIKFARNAGEMADFIQESLSSSPVVDGEYLQTLQEITWDSRINHIMSILGDALAPLPAKKPKKPKKKPAKSKEA